MGAACLGFHQCLMTVCRQFDGVFRDTAADAGDV